MRRFLFGMAIASFTVAAPMTALAGDREIADAIISTLKQKQADGSLKGFDIDLSVDGGTVTFTGKVASEAQLKTILSCAKSATGVQDVVNKVEIAGKSNPRPVAMRNAVVQPAVAPTKGESTSVRPASSDEPPAFIEEETAVSSRDAGITDRVISKLSSEKDSGALRHFELDISTVEGEVWARGHVANAQQKQRVLQLIQRTAGVRKVVDDITVADQGVKAASGETVLNTAAPGGGSGMAPRAFAPSMLNGSHDGGSVMPSPVPMHHGPSYGAGVPRYDQPAMPNYAWPSYAAYPNYAAVTYPKQYSASAWPYIGPFYPYPQVPLGWRKVTLEWDDGLWYLDYTSK